MCCEFLKKGLTHSTRNNPRITAPGDFLFTSSYTLYTDSQDLMNHADTLTSNLSIESFTYKNVQKFQQSLRCYLLLQC